MKTLPAPECYAESTATVFSSIWLHIFHTILMKSYNMSSWSLLYWPVHRDFQCWEKLGCVNVSKEFQRGNVFLAWFCHSKTLIAVFVPVCRESHRWQWDPCVTTLTACDVWAPSTDHPPQGKCCCFCFAPPQFPLWRSLCQCSLNSNCYCGCKASCVFPVLSHPSKITR